MIFPTLPSQREVYDALVSGKHPCMEDREVFSALSENEDGFKTLFQGLGMSLIADPRGFYYLEGSRVPANMKDILFFMAIFFEHLDEQGFALDETVFGMTHYFKDLPHLKHQRYAEVMERAAAVKNEDGLRQIVSSMARYRFLVSDGPDGFRFRISAFRLFDLIKDAKGLMDQLHTPSCETEVP